MHYLFKGKSFKIYQQQFLVDFIHPKWVIFPVILEQTSTQRSLQSMTNIEKLVASWAGHPWNHQFRRHDSTSVLGVHFWLVVSTHLKNIGQNWGSSPSRGENKKCLKPPPRFPQNLIAQNGLNIKNKKQVQQNLSATRFLYPPGWVPWYRFIPKDSPIYLYSIEIYITHIFHV